MTSAARWQESEDDFLVKVAEFATLHGWVWCHIRPARTGKGWRTPVQGMGGLPDLILARDGEVLLAELKADGKYPTPDQRKWLHHLGDFGVLWRPKNWDEVQRRLERRAGERGA